MNNPENAKQRWDAVYQTTINPFDLDEPYQWVVEMEQSRQIRGNVLDAGCGAGHNAIFLARKGYHVTGADLSSNAIDRARQKAAERNVKSDFFQADLCRLTGHDNEFDTVIDIGCFHSLDEDEQAHYIQSLKRSCRMGAGILLRCFSDRNLEREIHEGPAVSEKQLRRAFSDGWTIKSLEQREIDLVLPDESVKAFAWFATIYLTKS